MNNTQKNNKTLYKTKETRIKKRTTKNMKNNNKQYKQQK